MASTTETSKAAAAAAEASKYETQRQILEKIKEVNPEAYSKAAVAVVKENELPQVAPGDLITADLINAMIRRINALGGTQDVLRLGALAVNAHLLVALGHRAEGAGKLAGKGDGLWFDGERMETKDGEAATLAVLDGQTLKAKMLLAPGSSEEFDKLVQELAAKTEIGDIVMAVMLSTGTKEGDNEASAISRAAIAIVGSDDDIGRSLTLYAVESGYAEPFAWGLYNLNLRRFVIGGTSSTETSLEIVRNIREKQ